MLNFSINHPMKFFKFFLLALFVSSCSSPKAVYDYDETVQFDQITTYRIYPELVTNLNQLDDQRIISILSEELAEKGLSESANPDIYVNFYASEFETQSRNTLGVGVGGGGGNVGVGVSGGIPLGGPETFLRLTFDFIDAKKDMLIWQAVVEGKFDRKASPEKREERLRTFVKEALKGYPPKR